MSHSQLKQFGSPITFCPSKGQTIIAPAGPGEGNWAGAPSVVHDPETGLFYLYYRVRKPRPIRGGECHIASSVDGIHFETIWSATKADLGSPSLERFALTKRPEGGWILYPSYVDPVDGRWRIDYVEADSPAEFDLSQRKKLMTGGDVGVEGVKDPWVMNVNGLYVMLISYAQALGELTDTQKAELHATADIYNTGLMRSCSALAVSGNGTEYEWLGNVLSPNLSAWDAYAARLGCLLPTEHGWFGYYDGGASVSQNYEEQTGFCHSFDMRQFHRLTPSAPSLVSPAGSGSLRYVDVVVFDDAYWFYYEYARTDGSHELRMNRVERV